VHVDRDKALEFIDRFTTIAAGATTIGLLAVADRTGLLRSMAGKPARTVDVIAADAGLDRRYTREILSGLVAAGILDYSPADAAFALSDEHATVIADDASPYSMTGWLDMLPAALDHTDEIAAATRDGGGVPFASFGEAMVTGIDRASTPSMTILLTRKWLPTMPDVVEHLATGGRIADIGCGSGSAVRAMARAYPLASVVGFDIDERSIQKAIANTAEPNASFVVGGADAIDQGEAFDLVTMFDVVHDLSDPLGVLQQIRGSISAKGVLLMMEPRIAANLEDNINDRATLLYGISTFHCMTQSLAGSGAGLGAAWGPAAAQELCEAAGFTSFEELPIENPFSAFFRVG
jgi:2-polyprenyl-3-methyl-5-hydroxy-6-metoxy-1,4-benzoquinol methylase